MIYTELGVMATVASTCEECEGKRFQASVLEYTLGGRNIAEVLAMPVAEAEEFFADGEAATPAAHKILDRLADVGLGYLTLGQPLTTLSGGERQRLKLAAQMAAKGEVYVLDEPTTGLHLADVENLLGLLDRLVDSGKSVIVIEHHQAVMAHADWIIDLGPGAGHDGGRVVFEGTPGRPGGRQEEDAHRRAPRGVRPGTERPTPLDHPSGRRGHCLRAIVLSGGLALVCSLLGTRLAIGWFTRHGFGQPIRDDGPTTHHVKRGTPTMGGLVILLGSTAAYLMATLLTGESARAPARGCCSCCSSAAASWASSMTSSRSTRPAQPGAEQPRQDGRPDRGRARASGSWRRSSSPTTEASGPASQYISTTQDWGIKLPLVVVLLVIWFIVTATSNGANLTDGADGLLAGISAMVFGAYTVVNIWQNNQLCGSSRPTVVESQCYQVRDPLDLAVFAAAITGACVGFLWWNAKPARIIMGDVGSLAVGGALAGLAIMSRTELLMAVIAGVFVIETLSVLLQMSYFKLTKRVTGAGRRIFRIAPVHHHFEHLGWDEVTVVIRFWVISGVCVVTGLGHLLRRLAGVSRPRLACAASGRPQDALDNLSGRDVGGAGDEGELPGRCGSAVHRLGALRGQVVAVHHQRYVMFAEERVGQLVGRVLDDLVDVPAGLDHRDSLRQAHDGPALVRRRRLVGEHADEQPVAVTTSLPQQRHVAGVEQIAHHVHVDPGPAGACSHGEHSGGHGPGERQRPVNWAASQTQRNADKRHYVITLEAGPCRWTGALLPCGRLTVGGRVWTAQYRRTGAHDLTTCRHRPARRAAVRAPTCPGATPPSPGTSRSAAGSRSCGAPGRRPRPTTCR